MNTISMCRCGFLFVLIFGYTVSKPGFLPDIPYLFWTSNTKYVYYQNNTEDWIHLNEPPNIFSFTYGGALFTHLGCSYHYRKGFLLSSDNKANTLALLGEKSNGGPQGTFLHFGTSSGVGHVAVDWISSNVYWTDGLFGWIGLQSLPRSIETIQPNKKFRVVVDKFLDVPSGIAVHANKRFLFWTDKGAEPKLERSSLDGSNRKVLIWSGIKTPVSVTVDVHNDMVYFTDSERETVEAIDVNGNSRRILFYQTNSFFYGIETFKSYVFVSDQSTKQILVLSNSTGQKLRSSGTGGSVPFSLGVFAEENQPQDSTVCDTYGCNQICITEISGAKCLCEDGYALSADDKTCAETTKILQRSILVAAGPKICDITIDTLNSYQFIPSPISCNVIATTPGDVSYFTLAMHTGEIYYAKQDIIFRQGIFETSVASNLSRQNRISGLDYDWLTDTLYWSEESVSKIFTWNVSSDIITEITAANMGFPKALKVDPFKKRFFYIDGSASVSIKVLNIETSDIQTLESLNVVSPAYLIYNRRKDTVFWSDAGKSSIGSVKSDGTDSNLKPLSQGTTYSGITVYKDYLLWLSTTLPSNLRLNVMENTSLSSEIAIEMPLQLQDPRLFDMRVFDKALQPFAKEPCITNNDGCQHICIVEGDSSRCVCHLGYTIQSDMKSCLSAPIDRGFLLTTDIQRNSIYQINYKNEDIQTINILRGSPSLQDFDDIRNEMIWWDSSKAAIHKSRFDGSNEKVVKGGVIDVHGLTVDHTSGNIFYSSGDNIYVTTNSGDVFRKLVTGVNIGSLQIDSKRGIMVWIEGRPNPKLRRSYMDGTNVETIFSTTSHSIATPMDLAIDDTDGSLVWCDDTLDKIEVVNMATFTPKTIMKNRKEFPVSVAVHGEFIYYIARDRRSITKISKITGSNPSTVMASPLFGKLLYLTIYKDNSQMLHKLCSDQNGMCSKFCLPRGENSAICACENGIQIDSRGLCPGDVQCPATIINGKIPETCRRLAGDVCGITCDDGYQVNEAVSTRIVCSANGQWDQTNKLCSVVENNVAALAGGVAGSAVALFLLCVVVFVVLKRKKKEKESKKQQNDLSLRYTCPSELDASVLSASQLSTYTTLSEDRESIYEEIKEDSQYQSSNLEQPKSVEIPSITFSNHDFKEKSIDERGLIVRSERYSVFPSRVKEDNLGYLEIKKQRARASQQDPEPDYDFNDQLKPTNDEDYFCVIRTPENARRGSRVQQ